MSALRKIEAEKQALLRDLELGEAEMRAGNVPQARVDDLVEKAKQVEEYDRQIATYNRISGAVRDSRKVDSPALPVGGDPKNKVVTTPGHLFVMSDAYRQYRAQSKQGWSSKVDVKNVRGDRVILRGDEADQYRAKIAAAYEGPAVPNFGAETIEVDRDPDIVRGAGEPEILTVRDVMSVTPTTSDQIRFVKYTYSRAAASQAGRAEAKQWSTLTANPESVQVETIAVMSKVTEQDIDDAPRMVTIINSEMRLDVKVEEERQIVWGDGTNNNLEGLFEQGVENYEFDRAQPGDTIIDTVRRMRTDLRKRRVMPNALLIDPLDWEDVELQKSSEDEHYIWGVVQTLRGPQIWSLRVIESDAMTNPDTGERRVLMGDFVRGATLYDRHDVRLAVGFVDDDFARNLRSLRAEERLAVGVKRPHAFVWAETDNGGS